MTPTDPDTLRRIQLDVLDSCDEELELEMDDRSLDALAHGDGGRAGQAALLPRAVSHAGRVGQAAAVGGRDRPQGGDPVRSDAGALEHPADQVLVSISDEEQHLRFLGRVHHLLGQMPYEEAESPSIVLPSRERHDDDVRHPMPPDIVVPEIY